MTTEEETKAKSNDTPAHILMGIGAILTMIVGPAKLGAGASDTEFAIYTIGGFLLLGLGGIMKKLSN